MKVLTCDAHESEPTPRCHELERGVLNLRHALKTDSTKKFKFILRPNCLERKNLLENTQRKENQGVWGVGGGIEKTNLSRDALMAEAGSLFLC